MDGRGANSINKQKQSLTSNEKDAVEYYVSGDGMFINNILRERNGMNAQDLTNGDKQFIKDLDSATNKNIGETTLYRSVDASAIFGNITDSQYESLKATVVYGDNQRLNVNNANKVLNGIEGKTIHDKGYMSTTKDYKVAKEWNGFTGSDKPVVVEIHTNKNTKGADVSYTDKNVSKADAQKEVLLKRGQSYEVKSVGAKDGNIYIKVNMK